MIASKRTNVAAGAGNALVSDERLTQLLQEWGAWASAGCRNVSGFPTKSVLHQSWQPPGDGSDGHRGGVVVSDRREREMHECIGRLSVKLSNALVVVFVHRVPPAEQSLRLGCQPSTVRARVAEARRQLRVLMQGRA